MRSGKTCAASVILVALLGGCAYKGPPGGGYYPMPEFKPMVFTPMQVNRPAPVQMDAPQVGPQAFWTGKMQAVNTVTGRGGFACEYNYAGQTFTRVFVNNCPSSVGVQ